ncbi:hypothetical protein HRR83_000963 [Exophiala dermatitidis]|uniref:CFEM domain-containing protein n=2 Tax=Exophiala dermatitidis TaxID=5970 RepID=H6CBQ6_EXODN|nr:uncharacterized protein HMPREF1120_09139 [Exophiala dermatitidis NIH/UT8656]KAJ4525285.1 hypothetical protein HRR75_000876 [Exophiala dermatitidis]EHY61203.1 hypothetical protein HMPREF1120_09139 [Exophiala dermatitidis NIH/UT8656]KAJ4528212.1 hypothetical protein HRR74_000967 [Exophiala dermatitidis]KAJ4528845.1 hypothetical protein HRR73_001468 [Exophiala dermatitidis]KAJ4530236.1 hypothetical protein HRR76_009464 [Exophiala dermatitidis]
MHRTGLTLPLLLSTLALASPQINTGTLAGLPACAQDAASAALGSAGCPLTDTACICASTAFINAITNTILTTCSAADAQAAIEFGRTICGPSLASSLGGAAPAGGSASPAASPDAGTTAGTGGAAPAAGTGVAGADDAMSTTTVPVTLTSVTSIPNTSMSTTSWMSMSTSTIPAAGNNATVTTMTSSCTTTHTVTATMSSGTGAHPSAYTGAAGSVSVSLKAGNGLVAALLGVAGAVALL